MMSIITQKFQVKINCGHGNTVSSWRSEVMDLARGHLVKLNFWRGNLLFPLFIFCKHQPNKNDPIDPSCWEI